MSLARLTLEGLLEEMRSVTGAHETRMAGIDHNRQIPVPTLVADLVNPDTPQVSEPIHPGHTDDTAYQPQGGCGAAGAGALGLAEVNCAITSNCSSS